jgi:hypothetical protein
MSWRLTAVFCAAALGLLDRSAGQENARLTFQAKVSDLLLQTGSYARNKRPDDTVQVILPGHLVAPPRAVPLTQRADAKWTTPEFVVDSIRSASTAGIAAWIVENFAPADQAEVRKLLGNPAMAKQNQDYYRTLIKAEITASVALRGYTVLVVREESSGAAVRVVPVTLVKTPAGWKQTNALSKDETFDVLWAAVRSGTMQ